MRRRSLLVALATAGVPMAGCLDRQPSSAGTDVPTRDRVQTNAPATETRTYTRTEPGTAVRCRGEPIRVERALTDEPGYADDIEYFPENGTVRFVAARSGDEPAFFETMPFEQWASIRCAEAGLERVRTVTAERLGSEAFGSGMGQPPEGFDADAMVITLQVTTQIEDGDPTTTPTLPLGRVADAAPEAVDATVSLADDEFSRTVPVFAQHQGMMAL